MKKFIKGVFKKTIYKSDRGYIIGLFKVKDTNSEELKDYINKSLTFTGYFHELNEEEKYTFYGEGVEHPKYGFQFSVTEYEKSKPEDKEGLVDFLSSDLFPGIGEKIAESIVDVLGLDVLNKILEDPAILNLVPKLTSKKMELIYNNLLKYNESSAIIIYLTELGFSMKDAMNIYNFYKKITKDIIESNIYSILDNIEEIAFTKVDEIAIKEGINLDDKNRVKATIIYIMKNLIYSNGDTYLEYGDIIKNVELYLKTELNTSYFDDCLFELEKDNKIIKYNENYYLSSIWKSEDYVANKIVKLSLMEPKNYPKLDNKLLNLEKELNIVYNDKQKEAIKKALTNSISIITGGPGTGKTTIIKAIVELYTELNNLSYENAMKEIALLAPTGRASKRMTESTNLQASTIHRFLKWNKETNKFAVDEFNPDKSKFIIIDEMSMLDISLLDSLFKGLTNNIQVVLVGDYNQLPSVGPGQVLKDLIESEVIDTVHLDLLYRQDENSYINTLAIEIKNNDLAETFMETKSDYTFLECSSSMIKESLKKICKQIIDKGYDYKKFQLMAPMYHGENGIDNLNKELQNIFNPSSNDKDELVVGDAIFRENDKILQLVNMPEENVFNGDIGIIKRIVYSNISKSKKNEIHVDFDGNIVKYTPKDFNKFKHGYIISIHKSQGSEFDIVVLPVCNNYRRMLYRKLIYTAVTRAKRKLIIIGEPQAFVYAVNNDNEYIRKTSLLDRINNILYNK
ncbi:MAG: ATP-dependent RecD-like DNA helicase [Bacilli bacterium]|nr:ATP-dependent RecD-like DNA helicase [Bacilli bacterium]